MGAKEGSGRESRGVPRDVITHERGDEVVAVIVTILATQRQSCACALRGRLQELRSELTFKERIQGPDVHQDFARISMFLEETRRIVLLPSLLVFAQVVPKGLPPPWDLAGRGDRRES